MSGTVYQAAAGALLQQMRLDMLSNNLANINSSGFKADVPTFRITQETASPSSANTPTGITPYAPPMTSYIDFSPGPLAKTGNALDVAIVGKGFFEVQAPDGLRYTRKGNFTVNDQGQLSTSEGWPVMGQGGAIAVEGSQVQISEKGDLIIDGDTVNSLKVVNFANSNQLKKVGDTFFVPTNGAQAQDLDDSELQVAQGFLEKSNVDPIRAMTELIETSRIFETYQRAMRSADDANAKTVSDVGKV
ncbi:MAG: flagellar basal-body rod protein FlgF [Desulfobacteraceae bacterium]|nr:flagellar basal-body rod protein FlgF [Desulfobacteraceae bacterium]